MRPASTPLPRARPAPFRRRGGARSAAAPAGPARRVDAELRLEPLGFLLGELPGLVVLVAAADRVPGVLEVTQSIPDRFDVPAAASRELCCGDGHNADRCLP